jgi:methyl-accepting chemotaxis protein
MVQDHPNAVEMGINELECCRQTRTDVVLPFMHIGASYLALDSLQQAESALDSAYAHIIKSGDIPKYQESLLFLLYDYSDLGNTKKAKDCYALIINNPLEVFSALSCMAFAKYFESIEEYYSAAIYCKRVIDDGTMTDYMYEAAKHLFRIYKNTEDIHNASKYAEIYMQLSSDLDFGKRQELAATVNNQYQYHLDQKKEQKLKDEKEKYKNTLIIVSLITLLLVSIGYIMHIRRRNKHLKVIAGLSSELQRISDNDRQLQEDIKKKEKELAKSKKSLENTSNELNNVKQELQRVNNELTEYNEALKKKEEQLAERMEQNKSFIKLLHQSELEGKAEDVIHAIRQSS